MTLATGSRVGVYEVLAPLGAGGMGEVYRARDTRLKRDVAIKILPEIFAANPERLARFEREAQLLASLNHPHIAQIYGLEERALVMELVEGETLAARIARGPVPLDEALSIARQIAEALEAAHEQGIVHRDLKPANVKLAGDGTVKVLDFGLAKLNDPNVPNDRNVLSMSPTITSPALMTGVGVLLGTAAYMSPEQARGRPVDKRSDVWAFGCVLFEMLASARAFDGNDIAEVVGAVIHKEPDWSRLPAGTPAAVRLTLQRCLAKDPKQRLRDMGDVQLMLTGVFESREVPARDRPSWWVHSSWILFGVSAASLAVGAALGVGRCGVHGASTATRRAVAACGVRNGGAGAGRPPGIAGDYARPLQGCLRRQ
jgi:serine/threonine protein kinase